jgi:hypothetical protein
MDPRLASLPPPPFPNPLHDLYNPWNCFLKSYYTLTLPLSLFLWVHPVHSFYWSHNHRTYTCSYLMSLACPFNFSKPVVGVEHLTKASKLAFNYVLRSAGDRVTFSSAYSDSPWSLPHCPFVGGSVSKDSSPEKEFIKSALIHRISKDRLRHCL